MDSEIVYFTITGPPGTTIDPDLKQNWNSEWLEYWRRDKIANAKDGFYTFTLTPWAGLE